MWFARLQRRRRYARLAVMTAQLRTAEAEQKAEVTTDPEHEAWLAGLRARIAESRGYATRRLRLVTPPKGNAGCLAGTGGGRRCPGRRPPRPAIRRSM